MTIIRPTEATDEHAIRQVHQEAFSSQEGQAIADLTIALLQDPTAKPLVSLLACDGSAPIGHVLFTRVTLSSPGPTPDAQILAPLAVLPDNQRRGVGTRLVETGLRLLADSGCKLVFVLGHPEYYPRFKFSPAGRLGFEAPYPIPSQNADAWMVLELCQGTTIGNVRGTVQCADALNKPELWVE